SWSFISRMRGNPVEVTAGDSRTGRSGLGRRESQVWGGVGGVRLGPDASAGSDTNPDLENHLPAFRGVPQTYDGCPASRKGCRATVIKFGGIFPLNGSAQNGRTTTRITIPIISTVGNSFMIR